MSTIRFSVRPAAALSHTAVRGLLHTAAFVAGALAGVGAVPAAFVFADHATVVRWSNEVLNLISN